jgi:hypothetical protein
MLFPPRGSTAAAAESYCTTRVDMLICGTNPLLFMHSFLVDDVCWCHASNVLLTTGFLAWEYHCHRKIPKCVYHGWCHSLCVVWETQSLSWRFTTEGPQICDGLGWQCYPLHVAGTVSSCYHCWSFRWETSQWKIQSDRVSFQQPHRWRKNWVHQLFAVYVGCWSLTGRRRRDFIQFWVIYWYIACSFEL